MAKWAKKHDALIIVDEIQAGFGRTGKLFGYEHYYIEPDLVCCGKGISGNLPLSAVLGRKELISLDPSLTSTHGGHAASCAGALGNLETLMEDQLIERAHELGPKLHQMLLQWQSQFPDRIPSILGKGLVWAVFICDPKKSKLDADFVDRLVELALKEAYFQYGLVAAL